MKQVTGRMPVAGVYEFSINVPDDMSEKEVFEKVQRIYNSSSNRTKIYSAMVTGAGINYPLNFSVIDDVNNEISN